MTRHLTSGTPNKNQASGTPNRKSRKASVVEYEYDNNGEYFDYDVISTVSEYSNVSLSNPDNVPMVEDWSDNQSVASFMPEKSVKKTQNKVIKDCNDLVDFDEDTRSHIEEMSKYRDVTGSKVKHFTGIERTDVVNGGISDSDSDLEVDFTKIESNLTELPQHKFHLRNKYAEYNEPV